MHFKITCSCGRVIAQCRCPGEKTEEVKLHACPECIAENAKVAAAQAKADEMSPCRHGYLRGSCDECAWDAAQRRARALGLPPSQA